MTVPSSHGTRARVGMFASAILVLLLFASLALMSDATSGSARFSEIFSILLVVNIIGLLILTGLIGWNLRRLLQQVRTRQAGARLTAKVVVVFVALAVTPVVAVYYFSLDFLHRGIDSWFDVKIEQALEDSLELGRTALDVRMREIMKQTQRVANDLSIVPREELASAVEQARRRSDATELTVFGEGQILAFSNVEPTAIVPASLDETVHQRLKQSRSYIGLDPIGSEGLFVRTAIYIPSALPTTDPMVLAGLFPFTERMSALADSVQGAYAQYRELAYLRKPLKVGFTLTLSLVLALSLLGAVWAAILSARRMVAPLRDLAEGTDAVASGEFDTQLPHSSSDEVGFLVSSFNDMTRRLRQARDETRRSQQRVEEQRTYLEVVLARLSSGVITVDQDLKAVTMNHAAEEILDLSAKWALGKTLPQLGIDYPYLKTLVTQLSGMLANGRRTPNARHDGRKELDFTGPHGQHILMFSVTELTTTEGAFSGHVLVFDDITALVRAQRTAAWSEVARRLAHEIKNPLTPIQLSAERLRHKYLPTMDDQQGAALDRMTRTIVQQVDAMKSMVNAFSDYARSPQMTVEEVDLNELIKDVAALYSDGQAARMELQLDPSLGLVEVDRNRVRQVVHNLVKNALEAVAGVVVSSKSVGSKRRASSNE